MDNLKIRLIGAQGDFIDELTANSDGLEVKVREELDDRDLELLEHLEQAIDDEDYLNAHYHEMKAEYPDQWVVVYKGKVVANDKDHTRLLKELRAQGIEPGLVLPQFVYVKEKPPRIEESRVYSLGDYSPLEKEASEIKN